jgi:hypothetical protein
VTNRLSRDTDQAVPDITRQPNQFHNLIDNAQIILAAKLNPTHNTVRSRAVQAIQAVTSRRKRNDPKDNKGTVYFMLFSF